MYLEYDGALILLAMLPGPLSILMDDDRLTELLRDEFRLSLWVSFCILLLLCDSGSILRASKGVIPKNGFYESV